MPWRPLPAVAFAICIHPFASTHPTDLPLQIGDNLYIIEQGGDKNEWFRGYLVAPPSMLAGLTSDRGQQLEHRVFSGIFPQNCVEVREYLGEGKTGGTANAAKLEEPEDGEGEKVQERRKSQARRLSRALSRKRSQHDVKRRDREPLVDPSEPLPRDPDAPKPLAPVPLLRVGDEFGHSLDEPLVDEISSCLREWHDACLHEMLLSRNYSQLSRVRELIQRVDTKRKQLMHEVMTAKELATLREDTVWDLVAGNKMMHDEVIVRSPTEKGRILTAEDSVIEMTKLQANMSVLDRPPKASVELNMLYHVVVDVRNVVVEFDQPASLHMHLCTKEFGEKPRPISENYAIALPLPDAADLASEEQSKTLFVNLNAAEIGAGQETTQVFAVFKLLKDEPVRSAPLNSPAKPGHQHQASTLSNASAQKFGSLKGRRSVFRSHSRNGSNVTDRPTTAGSEQWDIDGGSNHADSAPPSRDMRTVKRIVGVGAVNLGKVIRQQSELGANVTLWTPATAAMDDRSDESEDWEEVVRELQRSANGGFSRVGLIKRFEIFATAFAASDVDSLVRSNPGLLHDVHVTQKLGFSGVPSQKRSDIYLTLAEPVIGRNAALQHSKFGNVPLGQRCQSGMANFQLTLEVRKGDGERIEDCIYTSSNHLGHTAWRTVGVEVGEAWNQTIKLAIPPEDVPGSHIVMSVADSPNFPFALAWIPLWENDAFVRDGDHQVAMYVYDEYSSSMVSGKGAYLALPPWHDRDREPAYGTSATLLVQTYLCSTQYSQDPNLLGLLNWRAFHGARLVELLEHFHSVPEIEVVKLLSEVFEALFQILHEYANSPIYEDIIFYDLVVIMTIAKDRRFNLTNVAENYAKSFHDWPYASQCLIRAFYRFVTNPLDDEMARKLRATLKVGDQMLRLIIQTKQSRHELEDIETNGDTDEERHESFDQDVRKLFVALMALMRNPMPVLLGTQTLVVQHFHTWLPELGSIMSAGEILETATDLLDACSHARGKMILYRLVLVVNYSNLDIFKHPDVRMTLIANTFRWLDPYWGETPTVTDQWRNQVRLCCSVVAAQMSALGDDCCQYIPKMVASYAALEKAARKPKRTFSMLFPTTLPFPSKATAQEIDVDEAMLEMSALLAAALMTQERLYFDANQVDVPGILLQALKVGQSILSGEAFPKSWMSLRVSHHRYAMTALERISEVLVETLPDAQAGDLSEAIEFDTDIWRAFFETLFLAVGSPALAMETFPEQKRRAIWKIAGDVREMGAALLKRSWEAIGWEADEDNKKLYGFDKMGGYQVQFVPDLVSPVVELCLSVHASLRNVAVEMLRSMIISTWEIDQDLGVIQAAMIDCLDKLCRTRQVTESMLQRTFINEMVAQFQPLQNTVEDSLYNAVIEMFTRIEELLGMLANVHSRGALNDATQIVDTLRLMEFLKDVQNEEAYIRYVHQLAELQSAAGNHTEAGLALQMHADRYEWDPSTNVSELMDPTMPSQTAFERKEGLYFEMCSQLEKGQCWTRALAAYKELAEQYETNTFDFSKLARSQRAMAAIHERIAKGERISPRYFRVVYKGLGFPTNLRDKEYIFEGLSSDRQVTFEERMQQLHPGVQILRGGAEPEVEGQFLQVYPVSVNKDLRHRIYQRTKVSQAAREYGLVSNPRVFTSSSRQQAKDVPITEQVVEKTVYTTLDPFPTLLRRSEILRTELTELSPVQAAVERTSRKTQELLVLERRIARGEDDGTGMDRLSEELLLSVDPDSASSVSKYRNLLPTSEIPDVGSEEIDLAQLDDDKEPVELDPIQNALKIALLDHALAIRRCLGLFTASRYLATRNELLPRFEATYDREIALLFPNKHDLLEAPSRRSSLAERAPPHAADSQTGAGAQANGTTDDPSHGPEPERRSSRRRSFQFLKRVGSAAGINLQANGHADAEARDGRSSRQASRGRGRDQSLSRRLSFFRTEQQAQESAMGLSSTGAGGGVRAPSQQSQRKGSLTGAGGGSGKKRFSFAKGGGLNSSGDYIS